MAVTTVIPVAFGELVKLGSLMLLLLAINRFDRHIAEWSPLYVHYCRGARIERWPGYHSAIAMWARARLPMLPAWALCFVEVEQITPC